MYSRSPSAAGCRFCSFCCMLLSAGSAIRWLRVEASLRSNRPLPLPLIGPLLAAGCAVAAAVVIAVIVLA
jgi:putative membrane protein